VLADGLYEWRKQGKGKMPMLFKLKGGEPFVLAGLWDSWRTEEYYVTNLIEDNSLMGRVGPCAGV
jgi:putative SOS response-associated peptidase YedK